MESWQDSGLTSFKVNAPSLEILPIHPSHLKYHNYSLAKFPLTLMSVILPIIFMGCPDDLMYYMSSLPEIKTTLKVI